MSSAPFFGLVVVFLSSTSPASWSFGLPVRSTRLPSSGPSVRSGLPSSDVPGFFLLVSCLPVFGPPVLRLPVQSTSSRLLFFRLPVFLISIFRSSVSRSPVFLSFVFRSVLSSSDLPSSGPVFWSPVFRSGVPVFHLLVPCSGLPVIRSFVLRSVFASSGPVSRLVVFLLVSFPPTGSTSRSFVPVLQSFFLSFCPPVFRLSVRSTRLSVFRLLVSGPVSLLSVFCFAVRSPGLTVFRLHVRSSVLWFSFCSTVSRSFDLPFLHLPVRSTAIRCTGLSSSGLRSSVFRSYWSPVLRLPVRSSVFRSSLVVFRLLVFRSSLFWSSVFRFSLPVFRLHFFRSSGLRLPHFRSSVPVFRLPVRSTVVGLSLVHPVFRSFRPSVFRPSGLSSFRLSLLFFRRSLRSSVFLLPVRSSCLQTRHTL